MAADGTIKILISAGLDRDVSATFGTIEKMAERTGRTVAKALGAGAGANSNTGAAALGRGLRSAASESDKASRQIEADFARQIKAAEKASQAEIKAFDKAAKERVKFQAQVDRVIDQGLRAETRAAQREADKQAKIAETAARKVEASHQKFANRTSGRAVKFLFPNPIGAFGMASRVGHDILRGAGVDFSVAGSVSRAVDVQATAQQLSNQGYRAGEKGPAGTRVEGDTLAAEARKVGGELSIDPQELLKAQMKFLDVTGDLDASRKNMKGLAEIAAATNTDFTAMAEAAGNISRHLEEGPDKAQKLLGIMRVMAGQGKVGSIEIKDFATQMAKIAALAPKFGGDVSSNITKLTTIAQLSRAEGGSATAAQAATATARFADIFQTPARMKKFNALGIDVYEKNIVNGKQVNSKLNDPFEIIRQSLKATGGDALKMADLFKSVMAQRGVAALTNAYNSGGGANMAAVNSQFATFGKESAITEPEVAEDNKKRMETTRAQAQAFQNALDAVVSQTQGELTPALVQLKGPALAAAHALGEIVAFTGKHPAEAIGIAITAAIARAGLESAFRAGIEKMIMSGAAGGGIKMLAPVAITIAAATIAMHLIDEDIKSREDKQRADSIANGNAGVMEGEARTNANKGFITDKQRSDIGAIDANLESRIKRAESITSEDKRNGGAPTGVDLALETLLAPERGAARNDALVLTDLKNELADNKQVLARALAGTLRVVVTNASEIANNGPKVYANGRGPDPSNPPGPWR